MATFGKTQKVMCGVRFYFNNHSVTSLRNVPNLLSILPPSMNVFQSTANPNGKLKVIYGASRFMSTIDLLLSLFPNLDKYVSVNRKRQ